MEKSMDHPTFFHLLLIPLFISGLLFQIVDSKHQLNIPCGIDHQDGAPDGWVADASSYSWNGLFHSAHVSGAPSPPLSNLRYFPNKTGEYNWQMFCYGINKEFPEGTKVTVTTKYFYGNYDHKDDPPTFFVKYDTNPPHKIVASRSEVVTYSSTYEVPVYQETFWSYILVCFHSIGNGIDRDVPFVNTIQIEEEEEGGGDSKAVKIAVPIVVIFVVAVAVVVTVTIRLHRKKRMGITQAPAPAPAQGAQPQQQYYHNPEGDPGKVAMGPYVA